MSDRFERAVARREEGERLRKGGDSDGALLAYLEAVALLRDCDAPLKLAHTLRHLGDLHRERGDLSDAADCYAEALGLYRANPAASTLDLANAVRSFAVLQDAAGDAAVAEVLWDEARSLYRRAHVPAGVANSASRVALLRWKRGERTDVDALLTEATHAAHDADDPVALEKVDEIRNLIDA